ncbi:MAG: amino acid adenylation domain-containing protein, partial [Gammaproteobacteria bacterium]|nr:amino acid adenylation domain-containing protein [Gammaproteobacteria bacterium]
MKQPADAFPLSPTQLALWRSGRGEEIISLRFRTDALATADRAGEAIGTLVARHEILRTACVVPPGFEAPLQRIGAGAAQDHYRIVGADNAAQAEPWLDPGKGHNTLLVVGEGWLEIRQPRLVADLYSLAHLADELAGLLAGEYPSGALPPQYADVAQWLLDLAEDPKAAPGRAFWERSGSPDSDSPGLYPLPRPAGTASGPLLPDLVQRLRRRAGEWNAPPDTILLAGWAGFLSRLFGAGLRLQVRLDGRAEAALREALGPLERFVPLAKTDAAAGLRDIHQRQERWLRDAVKWQDCFPSNGGATKSWEPATLFSLLPEPRRRDAGIFSEPSPAALELRVQPLPEGYSLEFAGRELDAGTAGHLLEAFTGLLERMLDDPAANVVTLPCVRPAQRDELSALSSITVDEPVVPGRITDQILAQAREHPSRVALAGPDRSLNYVELERESREMAAVLVGEGVAPGDTVGVRCRSTEAALIAMLAILRCGAVYVPLDLRWPSQRLEAAVGQATVRYLVSDDGLKLPVGVTVVDSGARHPDAGPLNTPDPKPDALAYIIFTSGSSGRPKGVCVSHANLAASTAARGSVYPGCVQRFLLLSPLAFDSSIAGIFWTLSQGGTLVLPAEGVERSPAEMLALIRDAGVTEFLCLPSLYRALAEAATPTDLAGVKRIIVAGESCPAELMRLHHERAPGTELYNEYGPSEATVWATVVRLDNRKDDGVPVSIGRAIPGAQVYVMDAAGELLPPGVAGELVIGGAGVAAGYCGPQAEGMSPFRSARIDADQRLYHSGDRGVLLSDGEFRFLGRLDRQVKVRGQRVEPEEIEAALRALPQVRAAAVIARPARGDSGSRLDALVEADTDHDWRNALRGAVPDYMVPGKIVSVPVIPRLANGKCDYRGAARLLDDGARTRGGEPRGEIEQQLAEIWKKLLGLEAVGREDGFFENGGDSILAIRMIALLQQKGLRLAPRQVFATPRLGVLAQHVQPLDPASGARASLPAGPFPLSPIQAYFLEQEPINPGHRNVARLLAPTAVLNPDRVGMLAAGLVERHATLRMRFSRAKTGWQQAYVQPGEGTVFAVEDLRGLDRDSFGEAVAQRCTRLQGSLNIETGPMFRMVLFQGQDEQRLLLLAHHLVADPVSLQVIVDDLSQALGAGGTLGAGPQPAPFHVWVAALERYGRSERLANQRAYWRGQAAPDAVRLPERSTCDGGRRVLSRRVGPAWLAGGAKVAGREVQARIVAALAGAVAGLAGQGPVRIDIEGHGRESAAIGSDIGGSVGWFTSLYPLRIDGAGDEALGRVRSALDGVPDGGIGFGVMQRQEKGLAPWAQVACNYLGRGTVA